MTSVNEFGYEGEAKVCDGCGEIYWQDPGMEYTGRHYTLIREEGSGGEGESSDEGARRQ